MDACNVEVEESAAAQAQIRADEHAKWARSAVAAMTALHDASERAKTPKALVLFWEGKWPPFRIKVWTALEAIFQHDREDNPLPPAIKAAIVNTPEGWNLLARLFTSSYAEAEAAFNEVAERPVLVGKEIRK